MSSEILVDTHILLWVRAEPQRLTAGERRVMDSAALRFISVVSLWEMGILISLGRIENNPRLLEVPSGYRLLPISLHHCRRFSTLPLHHKDSFDRMLVAQAAAEDVTLLTRDRAITNYADHATILRLPGA